MMNRLVSILMAYLLLMFVFYAVCQEPEEVEVAENYEMNAGISKFISDIEIENEDENAKRTSSKLEIINNTVKECNAEIVEEDTAKSVLSQSDIDLLATIVRAEAGNQSLAGKKAVVDVVLNRVDSEQFPNTIQSVIYQEGQFNCINDGNFAKALYTKDETDYEAVRLELEERTDTEIVFFQTSSYSSYGTPAYVIGDHYFAKQ